MAKARAIVKRRKAVRTIKKITKTMQMIATAAFQKAQKRALGSKPYTLKVRELVGELAATLGEDATHPLLRTPKQGAMKIALLVITSDRGLAGAYNGSVLRAANHYIKAQESAGNKVELYLSGKKGVSYFNFQRREITKRFDQFAKMAKFADVEKVGDDLIQQFTDGKIDQVQVAYTNFISASSQKAEVMQLLPLASLTPGKKADPSHESQVVYEFSPDPKTLLDELLPLTVKTALFQAFLDATTSENVARMVAMKSATDNADQMAKTLSTQYNRARQSQITTELAEIMGGVEAMKA
jgi:F-type H+-transporting ATPase subunit gamma